MCRWSYIFKVFSDCISLVLTEQPRFWRHPSQGLTQLNSCAGRRITCPNHRRYCSMMLLFMQMIFEWESMQSCTILSFRRIRKMYFGLEWLKADHLLIFSTINGQVSRDNKIELRLHRRRLSFLEWFRDESIKVSSTARKVF